LVADRKGITGAKVGSTLSRCFRGELLVIVKFFEIVRGFDNENFMPSTLKNYVVAQK
jgi:hypothetical protein